jgi:hypothetical protein
VNDVISVRLLSIIVYKANQVGASVAMHHESRPLVDRAYCTGTPQDNITQIYHACHGHLGELWLPGW